VSILRTPQFSAIALVCAAILGLVAANSPLQPVVSGLVGSHLPFEILGLDLSLGHFVTDGLLAIFFFLAAVELKHELRHGELDTLAKALVPTAAAAGGVIVPAVLFLLLVREPGLRDGWPIPTATDIAFALGILALVGRSLPSRVRALLLALAVIDDLIAIVIIAIFFAGDLQWVPLVLAIPAVAVFRWLSYRTGGGRTGALVHVAMVVFAVAAWVLVALSGVHPTIAGVALGLALSSRSGVGIRHALEPYSNAIILPIFAFVATLVTIPDLTTTPLGPVFWGIIIALPVGKLIGITAGALLASAATRADRTNRLPVGDLLVIACLGGIGFTVSLLMNELAFEQNPGVATEGTLGVIAASLIAVVLGGTAGGLRSRWYRGRAAGTALHL